MDTLNNTISQWIDDNRHRIREGGDKLVVRVELMDAQGYLLGVISDETPIEPI